MWRSSGSTPSSSQVTELLILSLRERLTNEETHFTRFSLGSYSFGHDPKYMTIGEGRNVDWPVNWELRVLAQLFLHHDRPIQWLLLITAAAAPIHLSVSFLNSSTWGRSSPPTRREHATFLRLRTMASDLEELILIPAASHSAANCCQITTGKKTTTNKQKKKQHETAPYRSC